MSTIKGAAITHCAVIHDDFTLSDETIQPIALSTFT
jgi:hypothetical protein